MWNNWTDKEYQYQSKLSSINIIKKTWKKARHELSKQWKLWSFYTPEETIVYLVDNAFNEYLKYNKQEKIIPEKIKILEPSVWLWSFIPPIVGRLLNIYTEYYKIDNKVNKMAEKDRKNFFIKSIFQNNIYMCDIDSEVIPLLKDRLDDLTDWIKNIEYNIIVWNFLEDSFENTKFDIVVWNPPYGVDINNTEEKKKIKRTLSWIDKKFDKRYWLKIKKESYSYFIVNSVELLKDNWILSFITSDTFLTLWTFKGLRNFLIKEGKIVEVGLSPKNLFKPFTTYPTASFLFVKNQKNDYLSMKKINKKEDYLKIEKITEKVISIEDILSFDNMPLYYNAFDYIQDFKWKKKLWEVIKTVGGLTTWNNKLFIEQYDPGIHKPFIWKSYAFYNKSLPWIRWFSEPKYVIKWTNNWEEIRKYKKEIWKWYLKWMWGEKYYFKEWIQINLIGSKINARYTPKDMYVFDAWSPMIVLRKNMSKTEDTDELLFIMAYLNSNKASILLKNVINHTRNIQPKNIEALPYPEITEANKNKIITLTKEILDNYTDKDFLGKKTNEINTLF